MRRNLLSLFDEVNTIWSAIANSIVQTVKLFPTVLDFQQLFFRVISVNQKGNSKNLSFHQNKLIENIIID